MIRNFTGYQPPVGFFFSVDILNAGGASGPPSDSGFQEVSGIAVTMETESITEGGENRFAHTLPSRTKYEDLVLKRGVLVRSSPLAIWCRETLSNGLNKRIVTKTIKVSLLDANVDNQKPIMTWVFENAYPIKWEVSSLDAQKSEIVIETLTFSYSNFYQNYEPAATSYPKK